MILLRWLRWGAIVASVGLVVYGLSFWREYSQASQAAAANQPLAAAQHLRAAAAYFPWQAGLLSRAAVYALEAGDYQGVVNDLTAPRLAGRLSGADYLRLGDAYLRLHQESLAAAAWGQALQKGASSQEVYPRLLGLHQAQKDYQAEIADREALASANPTDAANYLRLGELLSVFEPEAALPYLEQVPGLEAKSGEQAHRLQDAVRSGLLSEEPGFVYLQVGRALAAAGNWELARLGFERAVQLSPGLADAWAFRGEGFLQVNPPDFTQAGRSLEQAARLAPDSLVINVFYGLFWQKQDKFSQALPYFETAAAIEPGNPLWLVSIGQLKALLGDLTEAESFYTKAAQMDPGQADLQRMCAEFYIRFQYKIIQRGLPAALEAARLAPGNPANQDVLGQALFLTGDKDGALKAYQQALTLDEQYAAASLHLAVLYTELGKPELAYPLLVRAHQSTSDPAAADQAGRLLAYFFP